MRYSFGFSLVELSIVLVILGLLTGGILGGQSLIRAAQLRSVSNDYQRYIAAVSTFKDKYFSIPGDMRNATSFWGDQATGTGACADASIADGAPGTCNGDADGFVEINNEMFRFWQHLANAALIEGSYTGINGSGSSQHHIAGQNAPASRISNAGWFTHERQTASQLHGLTSMGNTFGLGAPYPNSTFYNPILKPEEVWNIDTKMDDGLPISGKVIAGVQGTCASATEYALTQTGNTCFIVFQQAY
jgi:prepilin-type N-terminal cleavage/methylation domain-containing protein